jgi:hypothetical protein
MWEGVLVGWQLRWELSWVMVGVCYGFAGRAQTDDARSMPRALAKTPNHGPHAQAHQRHSLQRLSSPIVVWCDVHFVQMCCFTDCMIPSAQYGRHVPTLGLTSPCIRLRCFETLVMFTNGYVVIELPW